MKCRTQGALVLAIAMTALNCSKKPGQTEVAKPEAGKLVLYCAGDVQFSKQITDEFEKATGIKVETAGDTESTRGIGLRKKIEQEKGQPRADVYWNNELVNTILLKKKGLLALYKSPAGADLPDAFRDPEGAWAAFGARARVFIVNTDLVKPEDEPKGMSDFHDPKWRGKAGMARPSSGTTATQAAALFELLGEDAAREFYSKLKDNGIVLCNGNGHVKDQVAAGELAWGWTDTNDANIALRDGKPVKVVYPDQGEGQIGTLLIPHSVSLVKGCPNEASGKKFVDFLLSKDTEKKLAAGPSAQIPVRPGVEWPAETGRRFVMDIGKIRSFNDKVSWDKVADRLDTTIKALEEILK